MFCSRMRWDLNDDFTRGFFSFFILTLSTPRCSYIHRNKIAVACHPLDSLWPWPFTPNPAPSTVWKNWRERAHYGGRRWVTPLYFQIKEAEEKLTDETWNRVHEPRDKKGGPRRKRCCYITVDPETWASENGICLAQQKHLFFSQSLYEKRWKQSKFPFFVMF
jgi:hypothetical protein